MSLALGGGEKCPRCNKTVYFAEERRALGRKYHSVCLKCMGCNKLLDSTNCNDHEGEIFCNACYRKKFGPKGYGFAGGASGLCVDTNDSKDMQESMSWDQVQAGITGGSDQAGGDKCPRCSQTVYLAEKVIGGGRAYHKLCFRCQSCSKSLSSVTLCQHDEDLYCKACYSRLFGPKGYGYAGGASGLSMNAGQHDKIFRGSVSHLAQTQVPSFMPSGGDTRNNELCSRCGIAVFFAERVARMGKVYHKACFKCTSCRKNLDSTLLTEHENNIYCKACYSRNFGPKGFGYGTALVHTQ